MGTKQLKARLLDDISHWERINEDYNVLLVRCSKCHLERTLDPKDSVRMQQMAGRMLYCEHCGSEMRKEYGGKQ